MYMIDWRFFRTTLTRKEINDVSPYFIAGTSDVLVLKDSVDIPQTEGQMQLKIKSPAIIHTYSLVIRGMCVKRAIC